MPKMYAVPTNLPEKDPVFVYKLYAEKRPNEMSTDEAPFYLAVNHCKKVSSDKTWFKKSALGVNTLNSLMKRMAEKAGLGPNISNHSGRKKMMQTLTNNDVPPTDIVQLSGHKNLQSVTNYSLATCKESSTSSISEHKPNRGQISEGVPYFLGNLARGGPNFGGAKFPGTSGSRTPTTTTSNGFVFWHGNSRRSHKHFDKQFKSVSSGSDRKCVATKIQTNKIN